MEPLLRKPLSHRNLKIIFKPYTNYNHILEIKLKTLYGFKIAGQKFIFASWIQSRDQNLKKKPTFIKEFFNKIWLKGAEHDYAHIHEIKFEKNIV